MIRYALTCAAGHAFESWFRDSAAFEKQAKAGMVACPVCGSTRVTKQIMAPAVSLKDSVEKDDEVAKARALLKALRQHVQDNAEDVGGAFAEEARRIHYGEADERLIYGQTSLDEAKELVEEGISVLPLPDVPDSKN
jgi:hypothetical protein